MSSKGKSRACLAALGLAAFLAGCATVMDGTEQTIAMNVTPADAQCTGWRDGKMVGIYYPSFQTMKVRKSRNELTILCSAYGYKDAKIELEANRPEWRTPVSDQVDYLAGTLSPYDSMVRIDMEKS